MAELSSFKACCLNEKINFNTMKRKIAGYYSILVGLISELEILNCLFIIDFFSGWVGLKGVFVMLILNIILIIGGIALLLKVKSYYIFFRVYIVALLLDRIIVFTLYNDVMSYLEVVIPLVLVLPLIGLMAKRNELITHERKPTHINTP